MLYQSVFFYHFKRSGQRSPHYPDIEETQEYWKEEAQNRLFDEINRVDTNKQAKNIILFLGDGMGISTLTAARCTMHHSLEDL